SHEASRTTLPARASFHVQPQTHVFVLRWKAGLIVTTLIPQSHFDFLRAAGEIVWNRNAKPHRRPSLVNRNPVFGKLEFTHDRPRVTHCPDAHPFLRLNFELRRNQKLLQRLARIYVIARRYSHDHSSLNCATTFDLIRRERTVDGNVWWT